MIGQTTAVLWEPGPPWALACLHPDSVSERCRFAPSLCPPSHKASLGAWAGKELRVQARIREEHVWKCVDVLKSAKLMEFIPEHLGTSQGNF